MNKDFQISRPELVQLVKLLEKEYISHEFYPLVRLMIKRAIEFLDENNELSNRADGVDSGS